MIVGSPDADPREAVARALFTYAQPVVKGGSTNHHDTIFAREREAWLERADAILNIVNSSCNSDVVELRAIKERAEHMLVPGAAFAVRDAGKPLVTLIVEWILNGDPSKPAGAERTADQATP